MKVVIHDRTEELAPRLRGYTQRRLEKLGRHFRPVLDAEVLFTAESKRGGENEKAVKILVHMDGRKHPVLSAEEHGKDLQAALDLALEKVDRQVLKLKDRIVHKHRAGPDDGEAPAVSDTVTEGPERVITRVKAESVSQAMDALEANGHLFHLFLDEDNGELNLIYRRADGTVSIIEPRIT
ncbi:MAG TPA: ribosome-associated translation inhibitor RaiA [Candidatus Dormibacteraeota bacterium]|nr:ribosome-associated translation inhibitor RaiA [Candidatus Dormibacteraeota bacterium]